MVVVAAVIASTADAAGSYYIPTPATPDFLSSPVFLWVAANVIIVWLVSSSRRRGRAADDDTGAGPSSAAHDGGGEAVVPGAVDDDSFYASEYEAFSDATPVSRRPQAREASAGRRSDRPRVRKKPAGVGQDAATTPATRDDELPPRDGRRRRGQEETAAPAVSSVVVDEDVSMDSLWASIVQQRAARPVVVRKSESWGNEELPRLQRVAETAARRQVRKSVSAVVAKAAAATPPPAPPSAARQTGWRTRDVLVTISPDDLLRRAESFIRRQREHLRLQRQESEQRQLLLQQRRVHGATPPAPLIRV
jgi:hypothetical protein